MSPNEIKQEVLAFLYKSGDATTKEIAEDLFIIEPKDKVRLNAVIIELDDEGMVVTDKAAREYSTRPVNIYKITRHGIDAIDETMDVEDPMPIKLPKKALPDQAALRAAREQRERQEKLNALLIKYVIIIDGETAVFDCHGTAATQAKAYASASNTPVEIYRLTPGLMGEFTPIRKVEFTPTIQPFEVQISAEVV